jgi:hypothetical protein
MPVRERSGDPLILACIEADVEEKLRAHQESCGAYACDPHVIVGYVLDAIEAYAEEQS